MSQLETEANGSDATGGTHTEVKGRTENEKQHSPVIGVSRAASTSGSRGTLGLASFQRELVCSICTEVLYQPLTILNCLHTFCGSCLKEWFSHQHRKASSSRSSSATTANPYSCPTCRAEVIDVQHNATVSNLLELFLAANPSFDRAQDDKDDMDKIYKPDGNRPRDKILPKLERRRERRTRRHDSDAARERQMIEDARQRSLRDFDYYASSSSVTSAQPARDANQDQYRDTTSAVDREERRQRRRDRERTRQETILVPPVSDSNQSWSGDPHPTELPTSSPRHPSAVEARQREQRMSHQASLRSLVSASEATSLTGDSFDEARIMQEIIDAGLLGDIDIDTLDEQEQDALAERIADLYRQRLAQDASLTRRTIASDSPDIRQQHDRLQRPSDSYDHDRRYRSTSARRSTVDHLVPPPGDSRARSASSRLQPTPPTAMARSNSQGSSSVTLRHRRRTSDQSREGGLATRSRQSSTEHQSASYSTTNLNEARMRQTSSSVHRTQTDPTTATHTPPDSPQWQDGHCTAQQPERTRNEHQLSSLLPSTHSISQPLANHRSIAEIDGTPVNPSQTYPEPLVTCYRCSTPNLQYKVHRHCPTCQVDLCMQCYRQGKGCKHWLGFGDAAVAEHEMRKEKDPAAEPSHRLFGRQYLHPPDSSVITNSDGMPKSTTSQPQERLQEGRFCDRCGAFANSQFWLDEICNEGEWGFCKQCVQTHRCCTHPLLPIASWPSKSENLPPASQHLQSSPAKNAQSRAALSRSSSPQRRGYDFLSINVNCDMCHDIIYPSSVRYHCPFHMSDYDICTSCYASFIVQNRSRRDPNAELIAGWRKCPAGHRMIMLAFEQEVNDDGTLISNRVRRIVKADLVGGWKMRASDQELWNQQHGLSPAPANLSLIQRGTWTWSDDATGAKRTRTRSQTFSKGKFPPDGGIGDRGVVGRHAYWPEDGSDGEGELSLPSWAELTEIEDINGDWWSGVYAGDVGIFPGGYHRHVDGRD